MITIITSNLSAIQLLDDIDCDIKTYIDKTILDLAKSAHYQSADMINSKLSIKMNY